MAFVGKYFSERRFIAYESEGLYPGWGISEPYNWFFRDPRIQLDREGIPTFQLRTARVYSPDTVAHFGLEAYNSWKIGGEIAERERFLHTSRWLVSHQHEETGAWWYNYDLTYRQIGETLRKPWVSALAQGRAISNLVRAYRLTGDLEFLDSATGALRPFHKHVEEGGVFRPFALLGGDLPDCQLPFYEEYPTRSAPSYVLNGFVFSLLGLWDLSRVPNAEARELFERGLETLRAALPLYDAEKCSTYDLTHLTRTQPPRRPLRHRNYHLIHIILLHALASVTGEHIFVRYRDRWNSHGSRLGRYGYYAVRGAAKWVLIGGWVWLRQGLRN